MDLLLWTKRFIGVCCVCLFLIFIWLLQGYTRSALESPYGSIFDFGVIALLASLVCGALLFGTAGATLLTGKYHEHRSILGWSWLVLGFLTVIFFFLALSATAPTGNGYESGTSTYTGLGLVHSWFSHHLKPLQKLRLALSMHRIIRRIFQPLIL